MWDLECTESSIALITNDDRYASIADFLLRKRMFRSPAKGIEKSFEYPGDSLLPHNLEHEQEARPKPEADMARDATAANRLRPR